jgi:hypothetical protein
MMQAMQNQKRVLYKQFEPSRLEDLVMKGASYGLTKVEIAETLDIPEDKGGYCIASFYRKLQQLERLAAGEPLRGT